MDRVLCPDCRTTYKVGEGHRCAIPRRIYHGLMKPKPSPLLAGLGDLPNGNPGARKDDQGKAPVVRGVLGYFPRAIKAVAQVSDFGAKKYAWGGWLHVVDGFIRYTDGLGRHLVEEGIQETDDESGLLHAAHAAWNALARLELKLRELEGKGQ
jgi:hypothetical protein